MRVINAGRIWRRGARSGARAAAPAVRAAAPATDRPRRTRPRARTRNRRGRGARYEWKQKSQTPARMQRHDAAGQRLMTHAQKSGGADHLGKGVGLWKFPDRFDEILI